MQATTQNQSPEARSPKPGVPQAVALFSGGLDSILAARMVMEQGIAVRCLHFVTPFFGKPELVAHWEAIYGISITAVNIGPEFIAMLRRFPEHGYGKVMNPCVDCKILMISKAREMMAELGASFIISGEVLGQRPMSQRRDTLNVIRREAAVRDELLRPLCAQHLEPTKAELSGLVDRSRLGAIFGRGRKDQLALARSMGLAEIPTPAGGCKLAEKENARRYWPVLDRLSEPTAGDFELANIGRQFWTAGHWLSMGRNAADNEALLRQLGWVELAEERGYLAQAQEPRFKNAVLLRMADVPGPLALLRGIGAGGGETGEPAPEAVRSAAALLASYAPRAASVAGPDGGVDVVVLSAQGAAQGSAQGAGLCAASRLRVAPDRNPPLAWGEPPFESVRDAIRALARARAGGPAA